MVINREYLRKINLFSGFSDYQLDLILPLIKESYYEPGQIVVEEGDVSDSIFIIKQGKVEICRLDDGHQHCLATLGPDEMIGEISLADQRPRSATVRAKEKTVLYEISIKQIKELGDTQNSYAGLIAKLAELAEAANSLKKDTPIYYLMMQNLAKELSFRIRSTNDMIVGLLRKDLINAKLRLAMGSISIGTFAVLCIYILVLASLRAFDFKPEVTSVVSIPLLILMAGVTYVALLKSGFPISTYGVTLNNWQTSVKESLIATAIAMILLVIYKWAWIQTPWYADRSLFEFRSQYMGWALIYILFVPLQEFIFRGALQTSLQNFIVGPFRYVWAILISNIIFTVTHFHVSIDLGLSVFVPGLLWGWLYSRHNTLVGVILSHQIFGIWALYFVGVE